MKKELDQHPAILTSHLVTSPFLVFSWAIIYTSSESCGAFFCSFIISCAYHNVPVTSVVFLEYSQLIWYLSWSDPRGCIKTGANHCVSRPDNDWYESWQLLHWPFDIALSSSSRRYTITNYFQVPFSSIRFFLTTNKPRPHTTKVFLSIVVPITRDSFSPFLFLYYMHTNLYGSLHRLCVLVSL